MLVHFRPRISAWSNWVQIYDVHIEPFNVTLVGGKDIKSCRPRRSGPLIVACNRRGPDGMDGLLMEMPQCKEFEVVSRWQVDEDVLVEHNVEYKIVDSDFDDVSDDTTLWLSTEEVRRRPRLKGAFLRSWQKRPSTGFVNVEPLMKIARTATVCRDGSRYCEDDGWGTGKVSASLGIIISRTQGFLMPTIERGMLIRNPVNPLLPDLRWGFRALRYAFASPFYHGRSRCSFQRQRPGTI
jgi:hypothetical protein